MSWLKAHKLHLGAGAVFVAAAVVIFLVVRQQASSAPVTQGSPQQLSPPSSGTLGVRGSGGQSPFHAGGSGGTPPVNLPGGD